MSTFFKSQLPNFKRENSKTLEKLSRPQLENLLRLVNIVVNESDNLENYLSAIAPHFKTVMPSNEVRSLTQIVLTIKSIINNRICEVASQTEMWTPPDSL